MLMRRSTHERIVAGERDKAKGLIARIDRLQDSVSKAHEGSAASYRHSLHLEAENARLRAQLARFTGARQRGPDGRFLKGAGK